jgi:NADH-quinone oxidoreductase subunit J
MMLDINVDKLREGFWEYLPMAGFIGILMVIEMALVLGGKYFHASEVVSRPVGHSNTAELGRVLYTEYLLPFELASVVLLVAIVAAIVLTLRDRQDSKSMNPAEQVKVRKQDRVRIVSMAAEVEKPPVAENPTEESR